MTRKEKELKMIEALDLKVGDRIKTKVDPTVLEIIEKEPDGFAFRESFIALQEPGEEDFYLIQLLYEVDWERIEPPLKYKKCSDFKNCIDCPLFEFKALGCQFVEDYKDMTLEELCNKFEKEIKNAKQEICEEKE